jgi:redox-sensitive bicupin YhaK (pirin superfamily)
VGAEVSAAPGRRLALPLEGDFEHAVLLLEGGCTLEGQPLVLHTLYYLGCRRPELILVAEDGPCRVLLIGGAPFQESILMWWNFVARTNEEIVAAREDWQDGRRFGKVEAYEGRRLEAPPFVARPVPRS